jgi:hypothetical protein
MSNCGNAIMSKQYAKPNAASIPAFNPDDAIRAYLPLMHELAIRSDLVGAACDGKLNLTPPYAREYAYLQFRRMCELIALGCLLLHGDLSLAKTTSAQKEWNADKIMRMLHSAHPHAFPQCAIQERDEQSKRVTIRANSKPNALTLQEFKRLYAECGEVLHRGTIRSLEGSTSITEADYLRVMDWHRKLVDLMNQHIVARTSGDSMYFTSLRTETGYPQCALVTVRDGQLEWRNSKLVGPSAEGDGSQAGS